MRSPPGVRVAPAAMAAASMRLARMKVWERLARSIRATAASRGSRRPQ
ncbi:MAG: hypothetical protein M3518_05660 [Actinomycetota bacterium]|nr:hypothetical protein [Actinomycetota bacterium]